MKKVLRVQKAPEGHWVGDGFPVRTVFSYGNLGAAISPFLLLDYAGPAEFGPSDKPRGVEEHPHRGFETVTIVFQGELQHRDSGGNAGKIGPGDVQWMTAASGVVHEEKHADEFTRRGGKFEVVQLWVNLPAAQKMSTPRYQEIRAAQIPTIELENGAGTARIIAGEFRGTRGPAQTFTPVNIWDLKLKAGKPVTLSVPSGFTTGLLVMQGKATVGGTHTAGEAEFAVLDQNDTDFAVEAAVDTTALLLSGQPIEEPVVSYGPFVMNTQDEIRQAITDYQSGRMGHLA